jgi:hypothetical protein
MTTPSAFTACKADQELKPVPDLDALLVGFGLEDDEVHRCDETFEMTCFHRDQHAHVRLLAAQARAAAAAA